MALYPISGFGQNVFTFNGIVGYYTFAIVGIGNLIVSFVVIGLLIFGSITNSICHNVSADLEA